MIFPVSSFVGNCIRFHLKFELFKFQESCYKWSEMYQVDINIKLKCCWASRPRPDACGQDAMVFGSVLSLFRTLKKYYIWYPWKAIGVGIHLALEKLVCTIFSYTKMINFSVLK